MDQSESLGCDVQNKMDKVKIGIVGVGLIGKNHLNTYSKIEDAEVVAELADFSEERLNFCCCCCCCCNCCCCRSCCCNCCCGNGGEEDKGDEESGELESGEVESGDDEEGEGGVEGLLELIFSTEVFSVGLLIA